MVKFNLSVHQLVDFLLRTGDIDERVFNRSSMLEGSRIHSLYQKKQGNDYLAEYFLHEDFNVDDIIVSLEGRADGIIVGSNGAIIDEIKSTIIDLDTFFEENKEWHLGQAKCYALMYAHEHDLKTIGVRLTYIHQIENKRRVFNYTYDVLELEQYIEHLISEYLSFYRIVLNHRINRKKSAKTLDFPFSSFRKGQRELAKYAYSIAINGGRLFVEAPTGIGKTISTLYPFAKSFSKDENDKIFYLTAKSSGRDAAFNCVEIMKEHGLDVANISMTAKDKICLCPGKGCNPDDCIYAKGYYSKIRNILKQCLLNEHKYDYNTIRNIAMQFAVCPFELELDLSLFVDIIICDYNYLYDPQVYLKRHFDVDAKKNLLLVDEAHNLIERGREMYSATINSHSFRLFKKSIKGLEHKKLRSAVKKLNSYFGKDALLYEEGENIQTTINDKLIVTLANFVTAAMDVLKNYHEFVNDDFMDFFFDANRYVKISEFFNQTYCPFVIRKGRYLEYNLYCLDPSDKLKARNNLLKGAVFFSATLSPIDYYMNILGGENDDSFLILSSPFPKKNLLLMIAPNVSTRYIDRDKTYEKIANYVKNAVSKKIGNYFVFCPSYSYLEKIGNYLHFDDSIKVFAQVKEMNEEEKVNFLNCFPSHPKNTNIGLVVMGGAFSEGIDMIDDRLIGAIIIGVGLPQICFERDIIRKYYDNCGLNGFNYSYRNPGMNRVMQAVGRVIRSEKDRGIALLIDDRFLHNDYKKLFRQEWSNYDVALNIDDLDDLTEKFFHE